MGEIAAKYFIGEVRGRSGADEGGSGVHPVAKKISGDVICRNMSLMVSSGELFEQFKGTNIRLGLGEDDTTIADWLETQLSTELSLPVERKLYKDIGAFDIIKLLKGKLRTMLVSHFSASGNITANQRLAIGGCVEDMGSILLDAVKINKVVADTTDDDDAPADARRTKLLVKDALKDKEHGGGEVVTTQVIPLEERHVSEVTSLEEVPCEDVEKDQQGTTAGNPAVGESEVSTGASGMPDKEDEEDEETHVATPQEIEAARVKQAALLAAATQPRKNRESPGPITPVFEVVQGQTFDPPDELRPRNDVEGKIRQFQKAVAGVQIQSKVPEARPRDKQLHFGLTLKQWLGWGALGTGLGLAAIVALKSYQASRPDTTQPAISAHTAPSIPPAHPTSTFSTPVSTSASTPFAIPPASASVSPAPKK